MSAAWSAPIGVEGRHTVDGRIVEPGAVIFPKGQVAVIDHGNHVIGYAENFRRDGDLIRADGIFHREEDHPGSGAGIVMFLGGTVSPKGKPGVITEGTLRAVYLTPDPAWPECVID